VDEEFKRCNLLTISDLAHNFGVRFGFSSIESSLVYPGHAKFEWVGVVKKEFVDIHIQALTGILNPQSHAVIGFHINNKYAIPIFQTASGLHKVTTWFLYQHDNNTWLIRSKD
jgi:hypothetical protein